MSKQTKSMSQGRCAARHTARLYKPNNVFEEMMEHNIHFRYEPVREAFHKIFDEAIEKYNEKQSRNDRKKTDYYKEIVEGQYKEKDGKKVKVANAPHPEYEYVFQYGNRETNPASILNDDDRVLGPYALQSREALKEFFWKFVDENPNLYITGASIHMDEATPHLHVRFIPVAAGYKTGMEKRCSLTKALENMGYDRGSGRGKDLSLFRWQNKQEQLLQEIGQKYGFEIIEGNSKGRERIETNNWKSGIGDEITQLEKDAAFYKQLAEAEEQRADKAQSEATAIIKECSEEITKAKDEMKTTLENKEQYLSEVKRLKSEESPVVQFHHAISQFIKKVMSAKTREEVIRAARELFKPFVLLYDAICNISGYENKHNLPDKERAVPELIKSVEDVINSATERSESNPTQVAPNEKEQEF